MKLSNERLKLFERLTQAIGISGQELEVTKILHELYKPLADEIVYDNLGSIYAVKKSKIKNAPKVMISAHMDEVGFHVGKILPDGTMKISQAYSGIWDQTMMSQRIIIQTGNGKHIPGVIDAIPPHFLTEELRKKPMESKDMIVDVGAKSPAEVEKMGIKEFDPFIINGPLVELNDGSRLLSKAFDNRYGCILTVETLQSLKGVDLPFDLYIGANVQEEVGLRGAETSTQMIKPDFAFVLDCSPANDMGNNKEGLGYLGEGLLIRFVDKSMIAFKELLNFQIEHAEKTKSKYQYYLSTGGTDAGAVHKSNDGVLTLTHCICARNIHTAGTIMDLNDYEAARVTLLSMLKALNKDKIESFKKERR
jgi:glutamyl aminopeptidase